MKASKYSLLSLSLIFCLSVPGVSFSDFIPYIGIDMQCRTMAFRDIKNHVFTRKYFLPRLHAGLRDGNFGLEVGYHHIQMNHGFPHLTHIKGLHVSGIGYLPLAPAYGWDLFASIGAARIRSFHDYYKQFNVKEHKVVPRLELGTQWNLCKRFSLRASTLWENKMTLKQENQKGLGSYGLSLGFLVKFF